MRRSRAFASSIMIWCVGNGRHRSGGGSSMIEMRRAQLSFGDGLIAEEVSDLREDWMKHADAVLSDEDIVAAVYEALARRHPKSRGRRPGRDGVATADPQAQPQLELCRARARGAGQSGVPRLHPRRSRQSA